MALAEMEDAMESRQAVSNFKSCCEALIETIPPGHHLTKSQELIVLSNLHVVESAIRVSHIRPGMAVYNPSSVGTENNTWTTGPLKMEILVRWNCFCKTPWEPCSFCRGSGHIDRWMPADLLKYVKNRTYLILARRNVEALS